jgi:integrase
MARKNLTKAAVEALAYRRGGPSRQVLWDLKVGGFGVRVTPEGGKQYVLLYRANGRQRLMSLGPLDHFKSLDEARTKAGDLLNGLRKDGTDPMAQRERMADADSMNDLWKIYERDHLAHKSKNTQKNCRSTWTTHTEEVVGSLSPGQVTKADVIRLHDRATKNGGKVVANRCVQRLRAILQWLFERNERQFPIGWRNPAVGLKLHKEYARKAILDLEQQRALLCVLEEEPDLSARVYLHLLLLTGLRSNELAALKWSDVDLAKGSMVVGERKSGEEGERKNREALVLPLPPVAVELLRSLPVIANNEHVFPSPRAAEHLTTNAVRRKYSAALKRAGLPHRTLHDLRRSYGTNHARVGVSTKLIAELLGNTAEVTARVYTQIAANDLRRLTDANAAALLPASGAL